MKFNIQSILMSVLAMVFGLAFGSSALAQTPSSVKPVLEGFSYDAGAGSYVAHFGYLNENASVVNIPVGADNKFSPSPQDRGQVTTFQPGRVVDAFSINLSAGQTLVWSLKGPDGKGRTSTATAPNTVVEDVRPVLEGIDYDAVQGGFVARFGYLNENTFPVTIPVGSDNRFNGGTQDRGQTTEFQPGRIVDAFSVVLQPGQTLVWTLKSPDGSTRTSTASAPATIDDVKPVLEGIDYDGNGAFIARFGYQNLNSFVLTIPVGSDNRFNGGTQDRGQTTEFQPGRIVDAFSVALQPGQTLVWTLKSPDGSTRTSTASAPTLKAVKPVLEGIDYDGNGGFVARFGYQNQNSFEVTIPVGAENKFTPAPQDRNQTTEFQTGRIVNAFSVPMQPGETIVWSLKGPDGSGRTSTATAPAVQNIQLTPAQLKPTEKGDFIATFGYYNPNAFAIWIPMGENNQFIPESTADFGQPEIFQPGVHPEEFSVRLTPGEQAIWKLGTLGSDLVIEEVLAPMFSEDMVIEKLNVYPNPNRGNFFARIDGLVNGEAAVDLIDPLGNVIYRTTVDLRRDDSDLNIKLGSPRAGIYFLRVIQKSGEMLMQKVIIEQ